MKHCGGPGCYAFVGLAASLQGCVCRCEACTPAPTGEASPEPEPDYRLNGVYHQHLDVCEHCSSRPFDLCPVGAAAIVEEARAKGIVR
jgi:hypothetical protein